MHLPAFGILTVSDSCYFNQKDDVAGRKLSEAVEKTFPTYRINFKEIIPDDKDKIAQIINAWVEKECTVILTTGGTGFSPRDVTPEATRAVIEREAPGLTHAMISKSLAITPMAMLSRAVCGIKNKSLIINLPGSAKGAVECFSFIQESLPHAIALILNDTSTIVKDHNKIQQEDISNPSKVVTYDVAHRPRESSYPMLEISEAVTTVTEEGNLQAMTEEISITRALNRVLAEDVRSQDPLPQFDASIKDGYAVIASDGEGPRRIRTAITAGDTPNYIPLQNGEAIRISTGAPIPEGADAVVQVEDTALLTAEKGEEVLIRINKAPKVGQDIRKLGSDIAKNSVVLERGIRLRGAHIGVLAAVGKSTVTVYKPPSVSIISTGNELREYGDQLESGQIRDSNRLALINLLKQYNYECADYGIVKDDPDSVKRAITTALNHNDILITTGGVSMGERDYIKRVLVEDFNATIHFGRVNIKPGKPTTFATFTLNGAKKIVFGLPGNPVSAGVTCLLFVVPLLRNQERANTWQWPTIPYVVSTTKENSDPRPEYVRVIVSYENGKFVAVPNGRQISSRLNSLVGANGLMLLPGLMTPNEEYLSNIILIDDLLI